jgi:serine/threonine-protein kinase RsbW
MTDDHPGLLLTLPARPENATVVRHAVAALAQQMGMSESRIGDLKTVVTEACMNVVVHAYGDQEGALQVEVIPAANELSVVVRDFGAGIRPLPEPESERSSLRIGLALIAALSTSFEISGGLGRGTEIKMRLALHNEEPQRPKARIEGTSEATELAVSDPRLIAPVLGSVVGALAARRRVTIDRLGDAVLITDAISERAPSAFSDGYSFFSVADGDRGIDLRVGPMPPEASQGLREGLNLPEVGGSLESLADELLVEQDEDGEYLVVRFFTVPV